MKKRRRKPTKTVDELVDEWTQVSHSNQQLSGVRDLVRFLSGELYSEYKPILEKPLFWNRLAAWLQNVTSTSDRQRMLELVPWLLFIGQNELEWMERAALTGPITRWIIEDARLDITDLNLTARVNEEIGRTFFAGIAGQFDDFLRINGLGGQSYRPILRDLAKSQEFLLLDREIKKGRYRRVVAVEDMVGSGTQMEEAAATIAHLAPRNVLLCPIVVAPAGVERWVNELKPRGDMTHVSFSPLFVIPQNATIPMVPSAGDELIEVKKFRELLQRTWHQVEGKSPDNQLYGPFGFGHFGSLVLSYRNCPDNVPPLVHYDGDMWNSLFPRVPREK